MFACLCACFVCVVTFACAPAGPERECKGGCLSCLTWDPTAPQQAVAAASGGKEQSTAPAGAEQQQQSDAGGEHAAGGAAADGDAMEVGEQGQVQQHMYVFSRSLELTQLLQQHAASAAKKRRRGKRSGGDDHGPSSITAVEDGGPKRVGDQQQGVADAEAAAAVPAPQAAAAKPTCMQPGGDQNAAAGVPEPGSSGKGAKGGAVVGALSGAGKGLLSSGFSLGDMVLLSADGVQPVVGRVWVTAVTPTTITVTADKALQLERYVHSNSSSNSVQQQRGADWEARGGGGGVMWRLDKDEVASTFTHQRSHLLSVATDGNSPMIAQLRELLVELQPPGVRGCATAAGEGDAAAGDGGAGAGRGGGGAAQELTGGAGDKRGAVAAVAAPAPNPGLASTTPATPAAAGAGRDDMVVDATPEVPHAPAAGANEGAVQEHGCGQVACNGIGGSCTSANKRAAAVAVYLGSDAGRQLNEEQVVAVQRVGAGQDYTLILGMPGKIGLHALASSLSLCVGIRTIRCGASSVVTGSLVFMTSVCLPIVLIYFLLIEVRSNSSDSLAFAVSSSPSHWSPLPAAYHLCPISLGSPFPYFVFHPSSRMTTCGLCVRSDAVYLF